jgi:hypothetical protein
LGVGALHATPLQIPCINPIFWLPVLHQQYVHLRG